MSNEWPDFNDFWDYSDPAATEIKFRQLVMKSKNTEPSYQLQLMTQIARTFSLRSLFDEAHALLDEVERRMAGHDLVEVRYLLERGRTYNSAGQPETAVPLFLRAYELAEAIGADYYAVDALHMLGIAAPPHQRLEWNHKAINYAKNSSQERAKGWLGSLYNNTGWSLFDQERYDEALDMFRHALVVREAQGNTENIHIARWCIARTLRAQGQAEEALAIQYELQHADNTDRYVEEEIAECLLALGRTQEAQPYLAKAAQLHS